MDYQHEIIPIKMHFVSIITYKKPYPTGEVIYSYNNRNLRFEVVQKWKWYFEYLAALQKVKNPKSYVHLSIGSEQPDKKTEYDIMKNRQVAKKRKITEYENKLEIAKRKWSSLFPIEEDPLYKKALDKVNRLKNELVDLNKQYNFS
jgi:hypothetical protein